MSDKQVRQRPVQPRMAVSLEHGVRRRPAAQLGDRDRTGAFVKGLTGTRRAGADHLVGRSYTVLMRSFIVFATILAASSAVAAENIVGVPRTSDGDTVQIGETKIRLNGIDAPESEQFCLDRKGERWGCGQAARAALDREAGRKSWTCAPIELDRYGRTIASCTVGGEDINRWMVRAG